MAKLVWDSIGERLYETGVNQGVLYPRNSGGLYPLGIAWNGLISVTESPSGAEATPIYADNIKYLNLISAEEFGATIEAYTYPEEFGPCDGSAQLHAGVFAGQQPRQAFGLAYKTLLGNDTEANEFGYKLHLVYGALAAPSEKAYSTINDTPEAITFSWEVTTTPLAVTGFKPTATLIIDSTKVDSANLEALEDILYGTIAADPYLPFPDEVAAIFAGSVPAAVALSSSDPVDDATGVLRTADIVLTFNNKILKEAVVVTTAVGDLVEGTKTWDATGKILTFDPTVIMAASTVHIVTIGGVVDIYNQALAPLVVNFTTGT